MELCRDDPLCVIRSGLETPRREGIEYVKSLFLFLISDKENV